MEKGRILALDWWPGCNP